MLIVYKLRFRWLRGLRRGSAASRLLVLWVASPAEGLDVYFSCCVLSGRGLCDELITRPEEFYRMWVRLSMIMNPRQ